MKNKIFSSAILAAASALALGLASTAAYAVTTTTTTFQVTANVQATCLVSATPLAFGTYNGTVNNKTSNVNVTCTNTTPPPLHFAPPVKLPVGNDTTLTYA